MKLQILNLTDINIDSDLYRSEPHPPLWYKFVAPRFSEINIDTQYITYDEIDKSKPWLLNIQLQFWHWCNFTGDIISCFPEDIQYELVNGSAYIILNHEWEIHTTSFFDVLYQRLTDTKLPPNKIIYLCNGVDVDNLYKKFTKARNLKKDELITTLYAPHFPDALVLESTAKSFQYDHPPQKQKKYLSLNRVGRPHRIMMVSLLAYYDLLDCGFVSLGDDDTNSVNNFTDELILSGFSKIKDKRPLVVDTSDFKTNHVGIQSLPIEYYQESYFSLVTATSASFSDDPSLSITEKEIKPILAKHPFILVNKPGTLQHMRRIGFMTFDKWFDESYDDELDDITRIHKIALEVKRLSSLSNDEWEVMRKEMIPILLHNYNRVVNYASERNYFNGDLKKLLHYVS